MLTRPIARPLYPWLLPVVAFGCGDVGAEPPQTPTRAMATPSTRFPPSPGPRPNPAPGRAPPLGSNCPYAPECSPHAAELTASGQTIRGEQAMYQSATESWLRTFCGPCHGLGADEVTADSSFDVLDSWQRLIELGLVVPGNAAESPLVIRMRDTSPSHPYPASLRFVRQPSEEQLNAIAAFVDNSLNFPTAERDPCAEGTPSLDEDYTAMLADLQAQPPEAQAFTRYLSLAQQQGLGRCGDALATDRAALQKLLNMVSTGSSVHQAIAIDDAQTLYRLDIRHYGWDRRLEVVAEGTFPDGWQAIAAGNPYATRFEGLQAQALESLSGSATPWMNLQGALQAATTGNLYYALIGVDPTQTLEQILISHLGIDAPDRLDQNTVGRAGSIDSLASRAGVLAERHSFPEGTGWYWQLAEVSIVNSTTGLFEDPLAVRNRRRKAIFTLPNGFLGFVRSDGEDALIGERTLRFDRMPDSSVERTALGCSTCHATGLFPLRDEVWPFVETNRFNFNADDYEAIQAIYGRPEELTESMRRDSASYQNALQQAGAPTSGSDPVSNRAMRFDRPLTGTAIAAELRVSTEQLLRALPTLPAPLRAAVASDIPLDRALFTSLYLESMCRLHTEAANRPHQSVCPPLPPTLGD